MSLDLLDVKFSSMSLSLEVLLLALAWDLLLGEPPAKIHPVVLMGRIISALKRRAKRTRAHGLCIALLVVFSTVLAAHLLLKITAPVSIYGLSLSIIVSAYLLKSTIAIRSLITTSGEIGRTIDCDIDSAKAMLPALVSRDASSLSRAQASSAVIESLSENYVDTILSPIFYYLLFMPAGLGVEAALAFKAVSTLDSMLGYRTEELIDLGLVSARLDDLANWVPARISVVIMAASNPWRAIPVIKAALRHHSVTPSPNSGWPMAAAAGALGVRLEKPGVYTILGDGREPTTEDITRAIRFVGMSTALSLALALMLTVGYG